MKQGAEGLEGTLYLLTRTWGGDWHRERYVDLDEAVARYGREGLVKMLREAADSIEKDGWWR